MIALVGRPVTRAGRTRRIALVGTLEEAIRAAESFAKMKLAPGVLANGYVGTIPALEACVRSLFALQTPADGCMEKGTLFGPSA